MNVARTRKPLIWMTLMLATGFCSMVYELALAQLLSGLLGNALSRFATTLGVYVFGMGLGSVLFKGQGFDKDGRRFLRAELALACTGLLAPFLFVLSYKFSFAITENTELQSWIVLGVTHFLIFLTGFFCGLELPALSSLLHDSTQSSDGDILAADYAGMFLASVAFPFLLYPVFGLLPALMVATFLNLVAALVTYFALDKRSSGTLVGISILLGLNLLMLAFSSQLQSWLSDIYASVV